MFAKPLRSLAPETYLRAVSVPYIRSDWTLMKRSECEFQQCLSKIKSVKINRLDNQSINQPINHQYESAWFMQSDHTPGRYPTYAYM